VTDTAAIQRSKHSALIALLGASFVLGIVLAGTSALVRSQQQTLIVQLLGNAVLFCIGFRWLQLDSVEHGVRRSALFNIGIVAVAIVFVPMYFFRTRPQGRRAQAVLGSIGLIFASVMCSVAGMITMGIAAGDG